MSGEEYTNNELLDEIHLLYQAKWENDKCSEETYDHIFERVEKIKFILELTNKISMNRLLYTVKKYGFGLK